MTITTLNSCITKIGYGGKHGKHLIDYGKITYLAWGIIGILFVCGSRILRYRIANTLNVAYTAFILTTLYNFTTFNSYIYNLISKTEISISSALFNNTVNHTNVVNDTNDCKSLIREVFETIWMLFKTILIVSLATMPYWMPIIFAWFAGRQFASMVLQKEIETPTKLLAAYIGCMIILGTITLHRTVST